MISELLKQYFVKNNFQIMLDECNIGKLVRMRLRQTCLKRSLVCAIPMPKTSKRNIRAKAIFKRYFKTNGTRT